jgi:hypothetical protein
MPTETPGSGQDGGNGTSTPPAPTDTPEPPCTDTPTPSPTPSPTRVFVGYFNLSRYYTTAEEQTIWTAKKIPILAVPGKPGKYLSFDGKYTDNEAEAQTAKRDFLESDSGVCMQGSGKLKDGGLIHCATKERMFEWGNEADLARKAIPFRTVAKCLTSDKLLRLDDVIEVDAPWLKKFLASNGNSSGLLTVKDNGGAAGLCNSAGHEGIDVYMGIGEKAYEKAEEFEDLDTLHEVRDGEIWWPVYRLK